jgi:two-component system sensor histidine kinase YesM
LTYNKRIEIKSTLSQLSASSQRTFDTIENLTLSLLSTPSILEWRNGVASTDLDRNDLQDEISAVLIFNTAILDGYIDHIFIHFNDGLSKKEEKPIHLYSNGLLTLLTYTEFDYVFEEADQSEDTYYYYLDTKNEEPTIYIIRKMYDSSFKKTATFAYKLNNEKFTENLSALEDESAYHILLNNIVYFSNQNDMIGHPFIIEENTDISILAYTEKLPNSTFTNYIAMPNKLITDAVKPTINRYLLIIFFIFIIAIVFIISISNYIGKFLNDLLFHINSIRKQNYQAKFPSYNVPELNELSINMNTMMSEINDLINKNYKSELLLKDADIHLLQSQISPHFFINTLATISTQALLDGNEKVYEMTTALSKMIDSSLFNTTQDSSFVTIEKELEYIKCYLILQKNRFPYIDFEIYIENDELLQLSIPRLSIEPIVENAVVHGIKDLTEYAFISINIRKEKGNIRFEISDNGGLYQDNILKENHEIHGIGIKNTLKRLNLLYGDKSSITYTCQKNFKTTAICIIPIVDVIDTQTERLVVVSQDKC